MSTPMTTPPRPLGRPIDTQLTERLLSAGRRLIVERGPMRLNADILAADQHAGKAGIYRRWPSMDAFYGDVLRSAFTTTLADRMTGDLIEDLVLVVDRHVNGETGAVCAILAGLMPFNAHVAGAWQGVGGPRDFLHLDVDMALRSKRQAGSVAAKLLVVDLGPIVAQLWHLRLATGLQDVARPAIRGRVTDVAARVLVGA